MHFKCEKITALIAALLAKITHSQSVGAKVKNYKHLNQEEEYMKFTKFLRNTIAASIIAAGLGASGAYA